ncbi:hypothetical protein KVT40_004060 [Elsinoe batatas]|uniref:Uncharacterized protein n=1 Tax=Elsinoe batatas TaxID=2601811 RepID=A0A8K0PH52_9PEZI|nr:hypothetical protein KVT40_004060 [Elsinoe batatas]
MPPHPRPDTAGGVLLVEQNISFFDLPLEVRSMIYEFADLGSPPRRMIDGERTTRSIKRQCIDLGTYDPSPLTRCSMRTCTEVVSLFFHTRKSCSVVLRFCAQDGSSPGSPRISATITDNFGKLLSTPAVDLFQFPNIGLHIPYTSFQLMRTPSGKVLLHMNSLGEILYQDMSQQEKAEIALNAKTALLDSMERRQGKGISIVEVKAVVDAINAVLGKRDWGQKKGNTTRWVRRQDPERQDTGRRGLQELGPVPDQGLELLEWDKRQNHDGSGTEAFEIFEETPM